MTSATEVAGGIALSRPSTGFSKTLAEEIKPLTDQVSNNPLFMDIHQGKASMSLIQGLGREFLPIVRGTYRRMAMRLQHAAAHDYELQSALLKEVNEEVWHIPMYLNFTRAIGLKDPDDFLGMYLPETYAMVLFVDATSTGRATLEESCVRVFEAEAWDGFNNYSQQSSLVQTMAASGIATRGLPLACDRLAEGFRTHYGLSEDEVEFWTEHGTVDLDHADASLEIVDRYATSPELQRRAREAAILSVSLFVRMLDAIHKHYRD